MSRTAPSGGFDAFGGGTFDGGYGGDDSGQLPSGGFAPGAGGPGVFIVSESFLTGETVSTVNLVIFDFDFGLSPNNDGNLGGPGEAAIKEAIANLLKNPRCAGLFGGPTKASAILGKMAGPFDVSPGSGYIARTPREMQGVSSINGPMNSVSSNIWHPAANGTWDGGPWEVQTGTVFNHQPFQAQLTIAMHEMLHLAMPNASALIDTPAGTVGNVSAYWISRDCGTALPNIPDLAIPTTPAPIPTTLVPPGS